MNKSDFKKAGIDKDYFSEIFEQPIKDYDINPVEKGSLLRAELYEFTIKPKEGNPFTIFAKDFWPGTDSSGEQERNRELDMNEVRFLEFGNQKNTFTPMYIAHKEHEGRTILFMEQYTESLEDKLKDFYKMREIEQLPHAKQKIEDQAFGYMKRAADVVLINNYIASTEEYKDHDVFNGVTIYEYDHRKLQSEINIFVEELLQFKYKDNERSTSRNRFRWLVENKLTDFLELLYTHIAKPLGENVEQRGIVNYDPNVGNILLKHEKIGHYDSDAILEFREGGERSTVQYQGFAVTDNNKIGRGSNAMIAILINHPAVFRLFAEERMVELKKHVLEQQYKLQTGESIPYDNIPKRDIMNPFEKEYAAASRFALLRNTKFITHLCNNPQYADKVEGFVKRNDLYVPESFVSQNLTYFCNLDDCATKKLELVNKAVDSL